MDIINLNGGNFEEEVLNSGKTVLIDFWASWCGPCKMMSPVVDEIAKEASDNLKVCKVNVDEEQTLALKYNVMSIPTFIVIKDGEEIGRTVGVQEKEEIMNIVNN